MPRPRDITPRSCPLCGHSDAAPPTSCQLCKGTKLISHETWARWASLPPEKSTSTSLNMRRIAGDRLVELTACGGPGVRAVIQRGELLCAVVDTWKETPAPGPERGDHYQQITKWLADSADYLREHRGKS